MVHDSAPCKAICHYYFQSLSGWEVRRLKQNPLLLKYPCLYKSSMFFGGKTYVAVKIYRTAGLLIQVVHKIFFSVYGERLSKVCPQRSFPATIFISMQANHKRTTCFFNAANSARSLFAQYFTPRIKNCQLAQRTPKGLQRSIQV